ncbi:MAG: polyprenyl synthetase family protein [Bacteroidales bacterium]|nr:polyprenyl synthetase family protein [Bacteroidales bacterium]
MALKEIKAYLAPGLSRVDACIARVLASDIQLLDQTNRMLREHPGKMLRPILGLLSAGAAGTLTEDTIRYASATELLHNASLLHDDVVDEATERRGLPTVATILGGNASVLLGDYWLVQCLDLVLQSDSDVNRVLRIMADTLGHLTEGEMLQMEKARKADTTQEDYLRIIFCKTASLFEAAALSAVISVRGGKEAEEALGNYARNIGIAYQISDDILDYVGEEIGKPVGIDLLEGKITQPLLCALEKADDAQQKHIRSLVAGIAGNPSNADQVRAFVAAADGVELARREMDKWLEKAVSCLAPLPESKEKSYLAELAQVVSQRKN